MLIYKVSRTSDIENNAMFIIKHGYFSQKCIYISHFITAVSENFSTQFHSSSTERYGILIPESYIGGMERPNYHISL